MNILEELDKDTQVMVQGITGKEGRRVTEFMLRMGVKVVGGVRPGKAGEKVNGVVVYDTVRDALKENPKILASCVYVPPPFVLTAGKEAIEAGVKLLHVLAEGVPVQDTAKLLALADKRRVTIIGPASLGLIKPGEFKLGSIGGDDNSSFMKGEVGVISRSGGMSSEVGYILTKGGLGQSAVVHVGGDYLLGLTPAKVLEYFEDDEQTKAVFMVGEVGGSYELEVVRAITEKRYIKPLVVFMAGQFVESLPTGVPLGHAGAIIQGKEETRSGKLAVLRKAGVKIVERPDQIVKAVRNLL